MAKIHKMRKHSRSQAAGFTLIELMIVVAVIATLAGIAYASYQFAIVKSRRAAAAACLIDRAQFMERWYTTHMNYKEFVPKDHLPKCDANISRFYNFTISPVAGRNFTLIATPNSSTHRDPKCGVLTINQIGLKTVSGTDPVGQCW